MPVEIRAPELFGVTHTSATIAFSVEDERGPVDARSRVFIDGELRAECEGAHAQLVRIEGLEPGTSHTLTIEAEGAEPATPDAFLPERFETLAAPRAEMVASFATMNDLHFGEPRFGGTLLENGDYGPDAPGFPSTHAGETDVPYWRFMNDDAIAEINAADVDATFIKGDIADRGLPEQFGFAAESFAKFEQPHHAFLGNHDYYAVEDGLEVDGYALLGQPRAPRSVELGGWQVILLETVEPGEHHGVFGEARRAWLAQALEATRESATPTLVMMHHQPVPPQYANSYPNNIGMEPADSVALFELLAAHPQLRGVLIGHTHRNRVRRYAPTGSLPFIEVQCTKDYPGGFGHYTLYEDGSFRQEVRRTSSPRALAHSTKCRDFFRGGYRSFSLGTLAERSFHIATR
jgi:hypothetical protein